LLAREQIDLLGGSCENPWFIELWRGQTSFADIGDWLDQAPYLADLNNAVLTTVIDLGADGRPARTQVWAGEPDEGILLTSWERQSEEVLPANRVAAAIFDPKAPDAPIHWVASSDDARVSGAIASITPEQALQRNPSPLFGLVDPSVLAVPMDIEAGPPLGTPRIPQISGENLVFAQALQEGAALRFSYAISDTLGQRIVQIYEGSTATFGGYLRDYARWQGSAPITLTIGDKPVEGWAVSVQAAAPNWVLFELNGTLIAMSTPLPGGAPDTLNELRALEQP
jgi:hypothetical protein